MDPNELTHLHYAEARGGIRDGDLLLCRGWSLMSRLIRLGGQSPYSHAGMAAWRDGELRLLEVIAWHGGRESSLLDWVIGEPAAWDVYAANDDNAFPCFDRAAAVASMRQFVDQPYGWANVCGTSLLHLAGIRFFAWPNRNDLSTSTRPPFCSEAVARATRAGGVDPVRNLADRYTEPHHLSESPFYDYRFTLIP